MVILGGIKMLSKEFNVIEVQKVIEIFAFHVFSVAERICFRSLEL